MRVSNITRMRNYDGTASPATLTRGTSAGSETAPLILASILTHARPPSHLAEEDDDDDDDDLEDGQSGDPVLTHQSVRHRGGVNRVRVRSFAERLPSPL